MTTLPKTPAHPGAFAREHVIPAGMSVKDAAKRLHIGPPALSNFLNGKLALSPQMAVRLEKAFGADRKKLLDYEYVMLCYWQMMTQKAAASLLRVSPSTLSEQLHRSIERHRAGHGSRALRLLGIRRGEL